LAILGAPVTVTSVTGAPLFLHPLLAIGGIRAAWIERVPDLDVSVDRAEAMNRLGKHHMAALREFAGEAALWRAEQVHGAEVAVVPDATTKVRTDCRWSRESMA
jgi:hypothetical protein